jgi:hypothetical protein
VRPAPLPPRLYAASHAWSVPSVFSRFFLCVHLVVLPLLRLTLPRRRVCGVRVSSRLIPPPATHGTGSRASRHTGRSRDGFLTSERAISFAAELINRIMGSNARGARTHTPHDSHRPQPATGVDWLAIDPIVFVCVKRERGLRSTVVYTLPYEPRTKCRPDCCLVSARGERTPAAPRGRREHPICRW